MNRAAWYTPTAPSPATCTRGICHSLSPLCCPSDCRACSVSETAHQQCLLEHRAGLHYLRAFWSFFPQGGSSHLGPSAREKADACVTSPVTHSKLYLHPSIPKQRWSKDIHMCTCHLALPRIIKVTEPQNGEQLQCLTACSVTQGATSEAAVNQTQNPLHPPHIPCTAALFQKETLCCSIALLQC